MSNEELKRVNEWIKNTGAKETTSGNWCFTWEEISEGVGINPKTIKAEIENIMEVDTDDLLDYQIVDDYVDIMFEGSFVCSKCGTIDKSYCSLCEVLA